MKIRCNSICIQCHLSCDCCLKLFRYLSEQITSGPCVLFGSGLGKTSGWILAEITSVGLLFAC